MRSLLIQYPENEFLTFISSQALINVHIFRYFFFSLDRSYLSAFPGKKQNKALNHSLPSSRHFPSIFQSSAGQRQSVWKVQVLSRSSFFSTCWCFLEFWTEFLWILFLISLRCGVLDHTRLHDDMRISFPSLLEELMSVFTSRKFIKDSSVGKNAWCFILLTCFYYNDVFKRTFAWAYNLYLKFFP